MATPKRPTKEERETCRIITPAFRVSYPHLFKAQAPKGTAKLKFSITMLFPKEKAIVGLSPTNEPRKLQDVITNAKTIGWGPKEKWPKNLISPVADGDSPDFEGKDGYKDHWIIKASTGEDQRPSVVDRDMTPISEANDIYPGCYARAYILAYAWEFMGKTGVSFILDHVQKLKDGKPFGGRKPIETVFSPVMDDESEGEISESSDDDSDFKS